MGLHDPFESEDDVYEFCILRRREADAVVCAEELRLEHEKGFEEDKQLGVEETADRLSAIGDTGYHIKFFRHDNRVLC